MGSRREAGKPEWLERSKMLRLVSHMVRLCILNELRSGEKTVTELNEVACILQPNLSQHLAELRGIGLVRSRKKGAHRCYSLAQPDLVEDLFALIEGDYPTV